MRKPSLLFKSCLAIGLAAGATTPALAVYNQKVIIDTGTQQEIPGGSLKFELPNGTVIPVEEDDDGSLAIVFPGNRSVPGTLIVAVPGQPLRRINVPEVPPGSDLVIDLPRNIARAVPRNPSSTPRDADQPRVTVHLLGGIGDGFVPEVGSGVLIFDNGEDFAAQTDDRVSRPIGGGFASFPLFSGLGHIGFTFSKGDDRAGNSTPAGGNIDTGFVHTDFSPAGSTGLFLGNAGLDTMIERDSESFSIGGGYRHPLDPQGVFGAGVSLFYSATQTDVFANVSSPTFGDDITADFIQSLDDNRFTVLLSLDYDGSQAVDQGFFVTAGGGAGLDFYDTELESRQDVICNLCAAPDNAFTILVDDSRSGTSIAARGFAGLGIKFGGNLAISVNGFVEHRDRVAQIRNPRTGDDLFVRNQPTAIGFVSGTSYGGFVLVAINLN